MIGVRTRRLIARVTGPAAITWWSWLITAPFALTVMSGLQYIGGGLWEVVGVSGIEHLGVGLLLLAGWGLLRVTPAWLRAPAVFAIYIVIGAIRPLLFLGAGELLGIDVEPGEFAGRIAINIVVTTTVMSLIALGVDLVRDHRGVFRRLRAAQRAAEIDAEAAVRRIHALRHSAVDAVLERIEAEAQDAARRGVAPPEAARLLRALADEVVRPASHRLYEDEGAAAPDLPRAPRPSRGEWVAAVFGGMGAAPALPMAVFFVALVTPFAITQYGLLFGFPPLLAGFLLLLAGNLLVSWLAESTRPPWRLGALVAGYAVVGCALSGLSILVLRVMGMPVHLVWLEAPLYPIFALAVAFLSSLSARVRRDQGALEAAVQASVRAAARTRADYDHERAALARLLHSGVQSELIASALALGAGSGSDASAELAAVVDRIRSELRAPRREPDAAERVRAIVASWQSAVPLEAGIDDGVWGRLEEPARSSVVVDAISEGLANAVRHGDGSPVTLEVRPDEAEGVEVVVTSGGALSEARPGIGLRQLSERGEVVLREADGRVVLAVTIP